MLSAYCILLTEKIHRASSCDLICNKKTKSLILHLQHPIKTFFQSAWRQNHMAAIFENKKSPGLPLSSISLLRLSSYSYCSRDTASSFPGHPSPACSPAAALGHPQAESLLGWTSNPVLHSVFVFMYCVYTVLCEVRGQCSGVGSLLPSWFQRLHHQARVSCRAVSPASGLF